MRRNSHNHKSRRMFDENEIRMVQVGMDDNEPPSPSPIEVHPRAESTQPSSLKKKLEETLSTAESLLEKIELQINKVSLREGLLKDAIANGR